MDDNLTWRRSNSIVGCALAVLVIIEKLIVSSGLNDGLRYSLGGAIAVALLLGVAQLGFN